MSFSLEPLWLTVQLATVSTIILLLIGIPLSWWLARMKHALKFVLEAIVALPLVLPPTVLGFYLLLCLGPQGFLGKAWSVLGGESLAFSFSGLVLGSVIYSLPFVVQPIQNTFEAIGETTWEAAATLGAKPIDRFFSIILPQAKRGILTAATIGFAHTVGEFGVILMIGGNIPGQTRVASIAIYDHVEALEYSQAHGLSLVLLIFSFVVLVAVYSLNRSWLRWFKGTL